LEVSVEVVEDLDEETHNVDAVEAAEVVFGPAGKREGGREGDHEEEK
jgi:hypothetical protein